MISRRGLLKLSGIGAVAASLPGFAQDLAAPDYKIEIAPVAWELSPKHTIRTVAYNGQVPGALLRFKEGQPVTVDVTNRTERAEVVHWHGLFLPPSVDGATEEGTPTIAPGAPKRYIFTPRPAGFRWYHTHTMADDDLTRAQYGGQHGFLMVDARADAGRYDQEFFLGLHDWGGHLLGTDDGSMQPSYDVATINGKVMGAGEPLRVKQGQRVMLHVLNSSATEVHWVALAGHRFEVVALDGNAVAQKKTVEMLRLAPAERVSAVVEMNNPGVWVLGEVRKHVQAAGMAVVVEYAGFNGKPQWEQAKELVWGYEQFGGEQLSGDENRAPLKVIPLVFESKFRGHGAMERWTINGKSYPDGPTVMLREGMRYRLQFINKSTDDHPIHLHRHTFEVKMLGARIPGYKKTLGTAAGTRMSGVVKDTVLVEAQTMAEVEFTADHPGKTLLHCHQQNHMDMGFMMLFDYA